MTSSCDLFVNDVIALLIGRRTHCTCIYSDSLCVCRFESFNARFGSHGLSTNFSDSHSPFQCSCDKISTLLKNRLRLGNGLPTDMELELAESQRNATRTPSPLPQLTPCEQLKYNKAQLDKMETFCRCKQTCVDALMMMPDHHPDEPFYVRALTELQDIEEAMALAVSDIDSFEPCIIPGCPHHEKTPQNSPLKSTPDTNYSGKRKEISNFEYPPKEKRQEK
ncbi:hypothetical protein TNCV_4152331 [Trichonephila clavipes]|nr:hypothetical protein TNCV_4152331 [Trichonephila clavipes]